MAHDYPDRDPNCSFSSFFDSPVRPKAEPRQKPHTVAHTRGSRSFQSILFSPIFTKTKVLFLFSRFVKSGRQVATAIASAVQVWKIRQEVWGGFGSWFAVQSLKSGVAKGFCPNRCTFWCYVVVSGEITSRRRFLKEKPNLEV